MHPTTGPAKPPGAPGSRSETRVAGSVAGPSGRHADPAERQDSLEALLSHLAWRAFRAAGWTILVVLVVAKFAPDLTGPLVTLTLLAPFVLSWTIDTFTDLLTSTKEN